MIAPSYWIDPKTVNNHFLTVQYPEDFIKNIADFSSMPLRGAHLKQPTRLDSVVHIFHILILVAQFRSWVDAFLILLAVPPGLTGVLLILYLTNTPISVMSLMGMLLMVGIVQVRNRQRGLCAPGPGGHRGPGGFRHPDHFSGAGLLPPYPWPEIIPTTAARGCSGTSPNMKLICARRLASWLALIACRLAGAIELPSLTLQEAHETALRYHPAISVADLKALAARQVAREVQAGFFPDLSANAMGVGVPQSNTRLAAVGTLSSSTIYDREAQGLLLSQLITGFGRTANLTGNARLQAQAAANSAQATRQQILLALDGAFFSAQISLANTQYEYLTQRSVLTFQIGALH
jgi:hypothetical protein